MTDKPLNIYQRLNKVREAVAYLQKDAQVQGYKAVSHDNVTAAVRQPLIDNGVLVVPRQTSGTVVDSGSVTGKGVPIIRYEAGYDVDFINIDNPDDKIVVPICAHAMDQGDKAPGKSISYATKNAFLKVLNIETGESDESRQEMKGAADPDKYLAEERKAMADHMAAVIENLDSIETIKTGISVGEGSEAYQKAAEAWFELEDKNKSALWRAPTKGGIFTTDERKVIASREFRQAHYGVDAG